MNCVTTKLVYSYRMIIQSRFDEQRCGRYINTIISTHVGNDNWKTCTHNVVIASARDCYAYSVRFRAVPLGRSVTTTVLT
jgi:hypothetical protein